MVVEDFVPALRHIVPDGAESYVVLGQRCGACGVVIAGERLGCPACGNRHRIEQIKLAKTGKIYAHTVVHRSYPGVKTPFVAVTVDLDGGGTVRGTLVDCDPLAPLPETMRVNMIFRDTGQRDAQGRHFFGYFFVVDPV